MTRKTPNPFGENRPIANLFASLPLDQALDEFRAALARSRAELGVEGSQPVNLGGAGGGRMAHELKAQAHVTMSERAYAAEQVRATEGSLYARTRDMTYQGLRENTLEPVEHMLTGTDRQDKTARQLKIMRRPGLFP